MNVTAKRVVFYAILICVAGVVWGVARTGRNQTRATYSEFLQQVQSDQVSDATITAAHSGANRITYSLKNGTRVQTVVPSDYRDVLEVLQQKMVNIEIRDSSSQVLRMLANSLPFFVLLGFWVFMMRRLAGRDAK
jgi:cell division protease FtsH